jgi:hypothetical protein
MVIAVPLENNGVVFPNDQRMAKARGSRMDRFLSFLSCDTDLNRKVDNMGMDAENKVASYDHFYYII